MEKKTEKSVPGERDKNPNRLGQIKNVALVHYWLDSYRGGEKVLEYFCNLFPKADIFTHIYDSEQMPCSIQKGRIQTTFIQKLPLARRLSRYYLPLMPLALEQLDLQKYDLVISSESGPAKGVITGPDTVHVCYCHSPMRYLWDQYHLYKGNCGLLKRTLMMPVFHYLRQWDVISAKRVDHFIANSNFVARRIKKYYRRHAETIYPPVDVDRFRWDCEAEDYFITVSELVAYKRLDLIVKAFSDNGRPLMIIGNGPEKRKLQRMAGKNIQLLGHISDEELQEKLARSKALVYAATEDFGMVPVEAQAAGRPVIAYAQGGAAETVVDGETGVLFNEQTPKALNEAIQKFEDMEKKFSPSGIRKHAEKFGPAHFKKKVTQFIHSVM